ncbi:MAG: histidine phosphatase family protein [Planctomycetes bacterium]|nr:histidine phosphatase family protein [Planctomycetota bacterium]
MLLLAVRHAESRANVDKSAGLDPELTALGHQQAAAIASRLQNAPLKAIYSSPFRRCVQTAQPIAELLGMPVRIRPDITEFHHLPEGTPQTAASDPLNRRTTSGPIGS